MSNTRTRVNTAITVDLSGDSVVIYKGNELSRHHYDTVNYDVAYCFDENHPEYLYAMKHRGDRTMQRLDLGGPLDIVKIEWSKPDGVLSSPIGSGNTKLFLRTYDGQVIANIPSFGGESRPATLDELKVHAPITSVAGRIALGGTAISRCKPADPQAAFAVAAVEIYRDGVPKLLSNFMQRDRINYFRSLGSNYLNLSFGWAPFISDLRKTAVALLRHDQILTDLAKFSGKPLRRAYHFPDEFENVRTEDNIPPYPPLDAYIIGDMGRRVTWTETRTRTWFEGEFTYRVPDLQGFSGIRPKLRQLVGLDVTPETLWDMTPWTWFADWFANTGDILSNVSAISSDDLVMHYGYLMQESTMKRTTTHFGVKAKELGEIRPVFSGSVTVSRKTRMAASPYGFGLVWDGFSPRQLATLAALGMTKR